MTNLITSYQNLILFEAAAQYTKEDPCKYQRYAPLLQGFMEQMAKNEVPLAPSCLLLLFLLVDFPRIFERPPSEVS